MTDWGEWEWTEADRREQERQSLVARVKALPAGSRVAVMEGSYMTYWTREDLLDNLAFEPFRRQVLDGIFGEAC